MDRRNFGKKVLLSWVPWLVVIHYPKTIKIDPEHIKMILEVKKELLRPYHLHGQEAMADQYLEPTHYVRDPDDHSAFYIVNGHGQRLSFQRNTNGSVRLHISVTS